MQILTPQKLHVLEMFVGVRPLGRVPLRIVEELAQEGFLQPDPYFGAAAANANETGVRATAPHFMKDITPCN